MFSNGLVEIHDEMLNQQEDSFLWSYMVLEKLGDTVQSIFETSDKIDIPAVLQIGIQIIEIFKAIHSCGYIYNDLKADNLMLGKSNLKIIDFGLVTKFLDNEGSVLEIKQKNYFYGNKYFSSYDQMMLFSTSCKDDFISLCYFLIYLIDCNLHFLDGCTSFADIRHLKQNLTPDNLFQTENSQIIKTFVNEVFDLDNSETPNYDKLKFLLIKELLNFEQTPRDDIFGTKKPTIKA